MSLSVSVARRVNSGAEHEQIAQSLVDQFQLHVRRCLVKLCALWHEPFFMTGDAVVDRFRLGH